MTPVGATALWIAAARALETESEKPLFSDPYARALAGDAGFGLFESIRTAMGAGASIAGSPDPYLSIRTRFLDDALLAAVRERGLRQVVLLAAGMDTRAFRLSWPAGVTLYELDRDDIFDWKEPILAAASAVPQCDRRVIRIDLANDWIAALRAAGFDPSSPTVFVVERRPPRLARRSRAGEVSGDLEPAGASGPRAGVTPRPGVPPSRPPESRTTATGSPIDPSRPPCLPEARRTPLTISNRQI